VDEEYLQTGMTLRDYFAAKALQSSFGSKSLRASWQASETTQNYTEYSARIAYLSADAMMEERNKSESDKSSD
jgi:hypothetical protein